MMTTEYFDKYWHYTALYPSKVRKIRVKDYWCGNYIDKLTGKDYVEARLCLAPCNYPDEEYVWVGIIVRGNDDTMMEMTEIVPFEEVGKTYKHFNTVYKKLPHDKWLQEYLLKNGFKYNN